MAAADHAAPTVQRPPGLSLCLVWPGLVATRTGCELPPPRGLTTRREDDEETFDLGRLAGMGPAWCRARGGHPKFVEAERPAIERHDNRRSALERPAHERAEALGLCHCTRLRGVRCGTASHRAKGPAASEGRSPPPLPFETDFGRAPRPPCSRDSAARTARHAGPGQRCSVCRRGEHRLGVAHFGRAGLHVRVVRQAFCDDDASGVAALGTVTKGGNSQYIQEPS